MRTYVGVRNPMRTCAGVRDPMRTVGQQSVRRLSRIRGGPRILRPSCSHRRLDRRDSSV